MIMPKQQQEQDLVKALKEGQNLLKTSKWVSYFLVLIYTCFIVLATSVANSLSIPLIVLSFFNLLDEVKFLKTYWEIDDYIKTTDQSQ